MAGIFVALAAPGAAGPIPTGADLRAAYSRLGLAPKSQGGRGCCSLFAICGVLEFEFALGGKTAPVRLSEEYLNWASHQSNGRETDGSFFSDAVRGVRMFGICREALLPYAAEYDGALSPSVEARTDARTRRSISARWIKQWDVKTGMTPEMIVRIKEELAGGHPVAIGMRWPKSAQFDDGHVLAVPGPEDVFDGHSVVLVGYRDDAAKPGGGVFIFRNSSGTDWLEAGYAYLPYAYAAAYGNDALGLRARGGKPIPFNRPGRKALEAETLEVAANRGCQPSVQQMTGYGAAAWSGGQQLFVAAGPKASLTLALPIGTDGRYELSLFATRAPDFGAVQVLLDGKPLGKAIDLYAPEVVPTARLVLGIADLAAGKHALEFRIAGKSPASTGYHFGLDCLTAVRRAAAESR